MIFDSPTSTWRVMNLLLIMHVFNTPVLWRKHGNRLPGNGIHGWFCPGFARHWAVTGNDTESTLSLSLSSYRERALGSAVQCRKDIPAAWHWVFRLFFFQVAADKELIYWWLFSYHLHAGRQAQTRGRLRHIQPCCLQSPAFPDITRRGLTCTTFPCRSNSQTLLSASAF